PEAGGNGRRGGGPEAGGNGRADLLVEEFVPGAEVAVEGLLRDGRLEVLAVFDKPDPLDGPYFEETLYVTPSRLPAAALEDVTSVTGRACAALGLAEGPVHAELRVRSGSTRAVLIEVAARSIGGLCSRSLSFGTGRSLEEIIVAHALGQPLGEISREDQAAGVMMLPIPTAGTLVGVGGQETARAVPGITAVEISVLPGRPVVPLPEGDRYLGFVFARGAGPDQVEASLRAAHAALDIRISPAQ
ncbi:MAG: ATP-grasp domain-containing protein, partial [Acidimicrobiales bacterium]